MTRPRLHWSVHLSIIVVVLLVVGFPLALFLDMVLNRGNVVAQSIHHQIPECSSECHR